MLAFFLVCAGFTVRLAFAREHIQESAASQAAADPRNSSAWISLGLAAESAGQFTDAARDFETAQKFDHQYLPAWTAANFYFRHRDPVRFWVAAALAARMAYGDLAPLIDLADRMEPDVTVVLARLGVQSLFAPAYLDFLIRERRWKDAQSIAEGLLAHSNPRGQARLLDFVDRLIGAERAGDALRLCRRMPSCLAPAAAIGVLTNGNLNSAPSGHGFDWRVTAAPGVRVRWERGRLTFALSDSEPDEHALFEQPVLAASRRYRLRFEYQIPAPGLRWVEGQSGLAEQSSPVYPAARDWQPAQWSFAVPRAGLILLRLLYRREPGSISPRADAAVRQLRMETL